MVFSQFHFAQAAWLWGLLAIPVVSVSYFLAHRAEAAELLERFADRHLLVHLLKNSNISGRSIRIPLLLWGAAWACGVLAMAGPRWSYVDQQTFRVAEDLVIVLDLSRSMDAMDVKPSRIARARNEIEDILNMSRGTSIGLVAYAAVPHMVTPLTDDVRTIKNLLAGAGYVAGHHSGRSFEASAGNGGQHVEGGARPQQIDARHRRWRVSGNQLCRTGAAPLAPPQSIRWA